MRKLRGCALRATCFSRRQKSPMPMGHNGSRKIPVCGHPHHVRNTSGSGVETFEISIIFSLQENQLLHSYFSHYNSRPIFTSHIWAARLCPRDRNCRQRARGHKSADGRNTRRPETGWDMDTTSSARPISGRHARQISAALD